MIPKDRIIRPLHILMADDGSEHARAAAELLCDLPISAGVPPIVTVTVLAVMIPRAASNYTFYQDILNQTRRRFEEKGICVKTEILSGSPAEALVEYTEQHPTDLIVMGAKGLRATLSILLGGVAQQVAEYARPPVLVVRAPYRGQQRILLVTDGSDCSGSAVDFLAHFPLPPRAAVRVLHVLPPLPSVEFLTRQWPLPPDILPPAPVYDAEETRAWEIEEERAGQQLVESAVARLRATGLDATGVVLRGDAASEIIEYARVHELDLIVTGSRGLSPMKAWLLGSVSRKLVHYAPCSVLIVKTTSNQTA